MKLPLYTRRDSPERGRHLVASSPIQENQLVFVEQPLVALQSLQNISNCLVCRHCRSWLQLSSNTSWGVASGRITRQNVAERAAGNNNESEDSTVVACRNDCGELYCCEACRDIHWNSGGHALLCTGSICEDESETHPLLQFKIHAMHNNEVFLMVADAIVGMLVSDVFREKMLDFTQVPWWQVAAEPLLSFASDESEQQAASELAATLRRLCEESSSLLKEALLLRLRQLDGGTFLHANISQDDIDQLCTAQTFGKLIGSFEQNAIGIRQRNPLCRKVLEPSVVEEYKDDLVACLQQAGMMEDDSRSSLEEDEWTTDELCHLLSGLEMDQELDCNDLDDVFEPLDGTAMYATACKMNHSCNPNVVVLYKQALGNSMPLVAYCVALRDIQVGEELCISYIDSNASYSERQEALANYGFQCECKRCSKESRGEEEEDGEMAKDSIEFDEDNLFGPDSDDDDSEQCIGTESDNLHDKVDGEKALRLKREEMNDTINMSAANTIPVSVLAMACNYVVRVGSVAMETLPNDLSIMMQCCLEAVRARDFVQCYETGDAAEKALYSMLEANGSWPDTAHRQAYGCGALACSIGSLFVGSVLEAQVMLDKGFILGLPCDQVSPALFSLVEYFANDSARESCFVSDMNWIVDDTINIGDRLKPPPFSIPEASLDISSEEFESTYVSEGKAVVVRGFASDWIATSKWRDLNGFVSVHGHRLVPIELSSMMQSGGMKEEMMSFRSFITSFLIPSCRKKLWTLQDATDSSTTVAYLAQHPLLDQIPELCRDIAMNPRLCNCPPCYRNVWIGTGGTRTPLHFDSYDNLLVQIVGYKYVRVYDTTESDKLYVIHGSSQSDVSAQGNMSSVNCELEDFEEHPLARDAIYQEVYLAPGGCLFLPARMWHYVRSLSTSISVNYWW